MSYPPSAPAAPSRPTVSVIRIPVVALAILSLMAVGGIVAWGGGDAPATASPDAAGGFGASAGGEQAGPFAADGSGSGSETVAPVAPLNPADVAPIGGTPTVPTETKALLAWQVPGDWTRQLTAYQGFFPAAGYDISEQRISDGGGGGAWDIVATAPGYQPAVGLLYIGPNPADPSTTLVQIEIY